LRIGGKVTEHRFNVGERRRLVEHNSHEAPRRVQLVGQRHGASLHLTGRFQTMKPRGLTQ
jgi:hypothetical protein